MKAFTTTYVFPVLVLLWTLVAEGVGLAQQPFVAERAASVNGTLTAPGNVTPANNSTTMIFPGGPGNHSATVTLGAATPSFDASMWWSPKTGPFDPLLPEPPGWSCYSSYGVYWQYWQPPPYSLADPIGRLSVVDFTNTVVFSGQWGTQGPGGTWPIMYQCLHHTNQPNYPVFQAGLPDEAPTCPELK